MDELARENAVLAAHIARLEAQLAERQPPPKPEAVDNNGGGGPAQLRTFGCGLTRDAVERYSRQSLLDEFRPSGTRRLIDSTVLIVGAGGLGSTVALFLAAAGVGRLRIVDFDLVERSNLHRQVIHNDFRIGMPKAVSAKLSCLALNPTIAVEAVCERFAPENAERLLDGCDVVVDASDNVAARYVINDACALAGKVLVSGSAMRWEGQLTVYGYCAVEGDAATRGPCYRCLFPHPPPPAAVGSCNDTGVVGVAPGCIGVLQALEVQKVLLRAGDVMAGRMLLFDGLRGTYRVIRLRPRQAACPVCCNADQRRFSSVADAAASFPEYTVAPCGAPRKLPAHAQATVADLARALGDGVEGRAPEHPPSPPPIILDVRERVQYEMCALPRSVNYPLRELRHDVELALAAAAAATESATEPAPSSSPPSRAAIAQELVLSRLGLATPSETVGDDGKRRRGELPSNVFVVCRRGIASSEALLLLLDEGGDDGSGRDERGSPVAFRNVQSGLNSWAAGVDAGFPAY